MKTLIVLVFSIFTFSMFNTKEKEIVSNYSCPIPSSNKGRCTGSPYCSACRNCSRCAHCSNGGSCGVCGGGSISNNAYSGSRSTTKRSNNRVKMKTSRMKASIQTYYTSSIESKMYIENEFIFISKEMINLREEPTINSEIIEKLYYGDSVIFIEQEGEWSKVQSNKTENIGFILTKLLIY